MSENRFLYLSSTEVHSVLEDDYQLVIDSVEDSLKMMYRGTTIQPDKNSQIFDENYQNRINCMAATLKDVETSGMKWVSVFPENKNRGLKNVEGFVVLSEIITGRMKCVMNATELTSLRTAGVGAVAAKYLARKNSSSIGFIGAGEEAKAHFKLIYFTNRNINRCFVSSRTCNSVKNFIEELKEIYSDVTFIDCGNDYEKAVRDADIIVTAISSQEKILKANWIKTGALYIHVAGIEDEYAVAKKASKIICDNWECVKHRSQTIVQMYREGELKDSDIYADIAEIITGNRKGRESEDEFIYFNSVGLAVEDILFSNRVYDKAIEAGIGQWIEK
ncbi:ornithine cyclodeaminase family protein [Ruminococcus sp. OM05-10BH]|nr:ornithine cyclodeaminase family protein [Ruminococcus sp. OM05-10BH]